MMRAEDLRIVAVQYTGEEIQIEFSNGEKWKAGPVAIASACWASAYVEINIPGYWSKRLSAGEALRFGSSAPAASSAPELSNYWRNKRHEYGRPAGPPWGCTFCGLPNVSEVHGKEGDDDK